MVEGFYPLIQVYSFIIGISVGSFLNVMIYRIPNNKSIIRPRSKCTNCSNPINWYDNIPIFSFLILRGKCRHCDTVINIRYPLIELIGGLLALLFLDIYGLTFQFGLFLLLSYMLIAITFIDIDHYIIPNQFIIFGMIAGIGAHVLRLLPISMIDGIYGLLFFGGTLFMTGIIGSWLLKKEAMGFGDVKLAVILGVFLGFELSVLSLFLSFIFAAFMSIILLMLKKVGKDNRVPFGPSIAAGTLLTLLTRTPGGGNHIINWYFTNMF